MNNSPIKSTMVGELADETSLDVQNGTWGLKASLHIFFRKLKLI